MKNSYLLIRPIILKVGNFHNYCSSSIAMVTNKTISRLEYAIMSGKQTTAFQNASYH
jgi:hypothetical protein